MKATKQNPSQLNLKTTIKLQKEHRNYYQLDKFNLMIQWKHFSPMDKNKKDILPASSCNT